ncbi:MAG: 4-hydroxy-tetrahydrodipicolinate synthase [Salinispira sp.]
MFTGLFTALITPFKDDLSIDEDALRAIVDRQINAGADGLVPMGTTGESPTVSHEENLRIIGIVIDQARGRVPVIAGTGSNSTDEAVSMTQQAKVLGASASLQVAPYYNKPNQEGLFRHFTTIADQSTLPLIVYNIPGRSAKNIETPTVLRMSRHEHIVSVKEASGDMDQIMDVLSSRPDGFTMLSGVDELTFSMMGLGAEGAISVISNIVPELTRDIIYGNNARTRHFELLPLIRALFLDTNPIPVKYAMSLMGLCGGAYRLPLCEPSEYIKNEIRSVLKTMGLI